MIDPLPLISDENIARGQFVFESTVGLVDFEPGFIAIERLFIDNHRNYIDTERNKKNNSKGGISAATRRKVGKKNSEAWATRLSKKVSQHSVEEIKTWQANTRCKYSIRRIITKHVDKESDGTVHLRFSQLWRERVGWSDLPDELIERMTILNVTDYKKWVSRVNEKWRKMEDTAASSETPSPRGIPRNDISDNISEQSDSSICCTTEPFDDDPLL